MKSKQKIEYLAKWKALGLTMSDVRRHLAAGGEANPDNIPVNDRVGPQLPCWWGWKQRTVNIIK